MITRRIDEDECHQALRLSEIVYLPNDQAERAVRKMGFSEVSHIGNNGGPHVLVVGDANRVIIVARGTQLDDTYDLAADGWGWPRRDYQGGLVHAGFRNYWDSIWVLVEPYVLDAKGRELIFTGHSLGGIGALLMATWSGVMRRVSGSPLAHVITAGAPVGATGGFTRAMAMQTSSITMITNNLDPVTMGPLWPLYRHPKCQRLHLSSAGKLLRNPSVQLRLRDLPRSLWRTAFAFLGHCICQRSILRGLRKSLNEHDHSIANYREKFHACIDPAAH